VSHNPASAAEDAGERAEIAAQLKQALAKRRALGRPIGASAPSKALKYEGHQLVRLRVDAGAHPPFRGRLQCASLRLRDLRNLALGLASLELGA
jgi:hypothetical protein